MAPNRQDDAKRIPFRYAFVTDWRAFNKIIIDPVVIYRGADHQFGDMAETDKASLAEHMQSEFAEKLKSRFTITDRPGANTLRLKFALRRIHADPPPPLARHCGSRVRRDNLRPPAHWSSRPMFLSRDEVEAVAERLLARSEAGFGSASCSIFIEGGETQSLRFAGGSATTNVANAPSKLRVTADVDGRSGSVEVGGLEPEALERALGRAQEIARLLPPDPEFMPPLGPQNYASTSRYDEPTGVLGLAALAEMAGCAIEEGRAKGVDMFGCAASGRRFEAMATSEGLFAYDRESFVDFSTTARHRSDRWSGWAAGSEFSAARLDAMAIGRRAAAKAAQEAEPLDLEPGRYTVILEPTAVGELAYWLLASMNARSADEGRSFFSGRLGEALFHEALTIRSGPQDALAPDIAFGSGGLPQQPRRWIDKGAQREMWRSRYWAQKTGLEAAPAPRSFTVEGGATPLDEMIRGVRRGVLVTRFWYTNMLDPRSLLLTGLTRDGNFLVENGEIVAPVRNMRFNESLAAAFSRIAAIGPSERVFSDMGRGAVGAPPLVIEDFEFSSKSSGI